MPDDAPTTPTTDTPPPAEETPATGTPLEAALAEAEKWKSFARKHEDRAKSNDRAVKELEQFKRENQTEQEKALDAARAEGRAAVLKEVGGKLVDAEFRAATAGRLTDEARTALLEGLDRALFLTDGGDVDTGKVSKWLDRIAPRPDVPGMPMPQRVDFGQGRREQTPTPPGSAGLAEAHRRFGTPVANQAAQ